MKMHGEMLIGGGFAGGPCDQTVSKAVIRSPWDGRIIGTAAEGTSKMMSNAIELAHDAFLEWRKSPRHQRQAALRKFAAAAEARSKELAELMADEIGKPVTMGEAEIARFSRTFSLAADALSTWGASAVPADTDPRGAKVRIIEERFPRGVVLGLTPYNWPFNLTAHKIAAAVAVGNTIVLKPSPKALLSTYEVARLVHEAGLPDSVVQVLDCTNEGVLEAVRNPLVRHVSFTGSDRVGWMLKRSAHDQAHVTLELGGDAFAVICEDADWRRAVPLAASGAFGYAGQVCIKVQHVLIHKSVYKEATEALKNAAQNCPAGDPRSPETVCGPVIDEESANRIMDWISEAVDAGGSILAGGDREGNLIQPTLIENVPSEVRLAKEEVFGPVLCISAFDSDDEAIERVNRSKYGLQAGVFTQNRSRGERYYQELQTGGVIIGHVPTLRFDAHAYGGEKSSGFGREGVIHSMNEMSFLKTRVEQFF